MDSTLRYVRPVSRARRSAWVPIATALITLTVVVAAAGARPAPAAVVAAVPQTAPSVTARALDFFGLASHDQLAAMQGQLDLTKAQLDRATEIMNYSTEYKIPADLSASIHDIAIAERIEPELAFRLVKVESDFNERATSPVGAIGLTQIMPATARFFMPDTPSERLYERETNLRVGLGYLHSLVQENKGDLHRALLIYNRGEIAVGQAVEQGVNPSNGFDWVVIKGYKGHGIID